MSSYSMRQENPRCLNSKKRCSDANSADKQSYYNIPIIKNYAERFLCIYVLVILQRFNKVIIKVGNNSIQAKRQIYN